MGSSGGWEIISCPVEEGVGTQGRGCFLWFHHSCYLELAL